jgi:hypothetical protein
MAAWTRWSGRGCTRRPDGPWKRSMRLVAYDEASAHQQALARAQAIEQPPSAALAHLVAGIVHLLLGRDVAAALSHAATLRPLGGAGLEYGV